MFSRRAGRAEYWVSAIVLVVLGVTLDVIWPSAPGAVLLVPWLLIWTWRLHDFGRSGWYNLIPLGVMAVLAAAIFVFVLQDLQFAGAIPDASSDGKQAATGSAADVVSILTVTLLLSQLTYIVVLGISRGDPGKNKYGLPAPFFGKAKGDSA